MVKLKVVADFLFAHGGHAVRKYEAGQEIETDDADLVRVATAEGWAKDAAAPRSSKSRGAAPENKQQ
jgi:hypothetical protein